MAGALTDRVEPVACGAGDSPIEMYGKAEFGGTVQYACPTCGPVMALERFGETVERELLNAGEFA